MSTARTIRTVSWAALAALLLILAGVFGYQSWFGGTERSLMAGMKMGAPFKLVDHTGKPITDRALAGKPAAVFFGFTHCPEICPTTLVELSGWLDEIGDEGTDINAFFVSVDPVRDTPEIMRSYIENFSTRIVGVTGDPAEVSRLAKAWFVYFKKVPLDDGGYTMDHTASIFLVDADGHFKGTIAYGESSDTAIAKLRRLVKSASR